MKPIIGITVCIDRGLRLRSGADYLYVRKAYSECLQRAGGTPIMLGVDTSPEAATRLCDAFVLTGGDDLPSSFDSRDNPNDTAGAKRPASFVAEDVERIEWECRLLREIETTRKPVLGVCYGMQLLNLFHGGTLYQSVQGDHVGAIDHGGGSAATRHTLALCADSALFAGFESTIEVNSSHRQAVNSVAPGFKVTAVAPDGVVEAIEKGPWFGVEWHPETDPASVRVYDNFIDLLRRY